MLRNWSLNPLAKVAIGILRKYGADAHVYLPGVGTVNGITAGNYLDSAGTTSASVDNPVGLVVDSFGSINATQGTTANKPILRRGLLNQRIYSYDLANAAWNKGGGGSVTMNGNQATIQTTTTAVRYLAQTAPGYVAASGERITQAIAIKKTTGTLTRYPVFASEQSIGSKLLGITTIDTTNGIATAWSAYTGFTILPGSVASIADYGDLWLVALSGTTDTSAVVWTEFYPAAASTATQSTGQVTGAIGPDVVVAGMGLFQGTYTAQQIIDAGGIPLTTSAAASNPSAGKYWWQFDGVNDSLSLGAPLFQMSDDHCVICAFSSTSTAATVSIFALSGATPSPLAPIIQASPSANQVQTTWRDDSGTSIALTNAYTLGEVCVVSARKSGSQRQARKNGVVGGTSTTAMGPTTLTEATIGSWSVPSFHQGSIYPVIAIKGTVTDSDLLTLERFVGQLSGVSI